MSNGKSINSVFLDSVSKTPEQLLSKLLEGKLKEAGVKQYRKGAKALASHMLENGDQEFHFEDEDDEELDISIQISADDIALLEKQADALVGEIPEIVDRLAREQSREMLDDYRKDWFRYRRAEERDFSAFRWRLEARWGEALDDLRLLVDLCTDEGEKERARLSKSKAKRAPIARHALVQLHVRACQVAREILTLIENGFPDGAMARWRTLHEIEIIALLLHDGGNELARRYFDHQVVERKKAADLHQRTCRVSGSTPLSQKEMAEIEEDFDSVVKLHGKEFAGDYGWASRYLNNPNPRFANLAERAGAEASKPEYKYASYNVHASSTALRVRVGSLNGQGNLSAGSTNAGLQEPAQKTAQSILLISSLLSSRSRSIDHAILLHALVRLRDDAILKFETAAQVLLVDHQSIEEALFEQQIEDIDLSMI
ncbi:DUF5677 domain-containing protein [Erythrobacter rubeus]|uniref:Uncharacterized protein n=1 Tax=Erythrobacter rubeus TaxID=2760803 RepID=A0ABR8KLY4_9SPHN|nr:DUF5677 domain-containing protein [Erythrobacter rubeus]MBD2841472.1 hypothetical protein [Erythrobacter rubeus]